MNIGIDIDNTISNTREVIFKYALDYAAKLNLDTTCDFSQYRVEKSLGWTQEVAYEFLEECLSDIYRDVVPKENSIEVIRELHQRHAIILITSRNERDQLVTDITMQWLEQYGLEYDKLVMNKTENMHHFSKLAECLDNKIDLMIEDHHDLAMELVEHLPVLLFDYPYNAHINSDNITRVSDWLEIKRIILLMESDKTS